MLHHLGLRVGLGLRVVRLCLGGVAGHVLGHVCHLWVEIECSVVESLLLGLSLLLLLLLLLGHLVLHDACLSGSLMAHHLLAVLLLHGHAHILLADLLRVHPLHLRSLTLHVRHVWRGHLLLCLHHCCMLLRTHLVGHLRRRALHLSTCLCLRLCSHVRTLLLSLHNQSLLLLAHLLAINLWCAVHAHHGRALHATRRWTSLVRMRLRCDMVNRLTVG